MQKIRYKWICDWCGDKIMSEEEVPKFPHSDDENDEDMELEENPVRDWVSVEINEVGSGECIRYYDICPSCNSLFNEWRKNSKAK